MIQTNVATTRVSRHDWPMSQYSKTVVAGGIKWHVRLCGEGPVILFIHGTGASTHSWYHMARELASRYQVVLCDLPGHGFSGPATRAGMTLPGMSRSLQALLVTLELEPEVVVGHSAGAAIAMQMSLQEGLVAKAIVSINGAFLPFSGMAGHVFAPLAQLMANNPFVPKLLSWRAQRGQTVKKLLLDTGSKLQPEDIACYEKLMSNSTHVGAALGMMANWDLAALSAQLGEVNPEVLLIVGNNDKTVPPSQADQVSNRLPAQHLVRLPGLGHLAHEENPALVLSTVETWLASQQIISKN